MNIVKYTKKEPKAFMEPHQDRSCPVYAMYSSFVIAGSSSPHLGHTLGKASRLTTCPQARQVPDKSSFLSGTLFVKLSLGAFLFFRS